MERKTIRRGLVAVAIVLGFLTLSAPPAWAGTPDSVDGTITIGGDEELEIGTWANFCQYTSVDVAFFGSDLSGFWDLSGFIAVPFTVSGDATKYQADLSFFAASGGSYVQSWPYMSGTLNIQAVIRTLDKDGGDWWNPFDDCATGAAICTLRTRLIVDWMQSSHSGSLPAPATGDTTGLVATTEISPGIRPVVTAGSCPVNVSSAFVGQSVVAALTLTW
jgi:hypothetical protein